MKKFLWIVIILGLTCLAGPAQADISLTLELDQSRAVVGDSIRMVISLSGARAAESDPVIIGLENFEVTPSGRSSRIQIMNGKVSKGIDYTYYLQPQKEGTFRIGPAQVKVDDRTVTSNHATLTVQKASTGPAGQSNAVFLQAELSKKQVFVEEQAIYTLRLFYRIRIRDVQLGLPEKDGLVFKQIGKPKEYQRTIEGQVYQVLEVPYVLTAAKPGVYGVDPAKMVMQVVQQNRRSLFNNFFEDPFLSPSRPATVFSDALELKVDALPLEGRPADFSGMVGEFALSSSLAPDHIKAGESATLTVQIKGVGNVNRIPDLQVPAQDGIKVYADQPALQAQDTAKGFGGAKVMKWAFVPEAPGGVNIPPLTVSYFDTSGGGYEQLRTPAYTLSVEPGETVGITSVQPTPAPQPAEKAPVKNQIKELGQDILPIHTNITRLARPRSFFPDHWLIGVGVFAPFLVFLTGFLTTRLRRTSPRSLANARARKACRTMIRRCRRQGVCHQELLDEIRQYINDRFRLNIGSLTAHDAAEMLRERGVSGDTADRIRTLVERIEQAIYTGQGTQPTDLTAEACRVAEAVEKEIR